MEKQFTVDGNLSHNNQAYKTGDPIVLNEQEAAPLLAIGRIKPVETKASEEVVPAPAPAQPTPEPAPAPAPAATQQSAPAAQPPMTPPAPAQPRTGQPSAEDIARTVAEVE